MSFDYSAKTQDLLQRMQAFFDEHIYPNEERHHRELDEMRRADKGWHHLPLIEELKPKARKAGLWNMFLPHAYEDNGA